MHSRLISILIFMISTSLYSQESWTGINSCGLYRAKGTVQLSKDGPVVIVNEKTKSEIIISVPIQNEPIMAPYIGKPIEASIEFKKISKDSKIIGTVKTIKSRLPNPINPRDTEIILISKGVCE